VGVEASECSDGTGPDAAKRLGVESCLLSGWVVGVFPGVEGEDRGPSLSDVAVVVVDPLDDQPSRDGFVAEHAPAQARTAVVATVSWPWNAPNEPKCSPTASARSPPSGDMCVELSSGLQTL
jgi:hypothetical protein